MDIEEAIKHAREKAVELGDCECSMEHLQLAEWLEELKYCRKRTEIIPVVEKIVFGCVIITICFIVCATFALELLRQYA